MNLREDIVQRPTIPRDPGEKLNYNANRLMAAAVTQTFHDRKWLRIQFHRDGPSRGISTCDEMTRQRCTTI